jgi:hypothetical protein
LLQKAAMRASLYTSGSPSSSTASGSKSSASRRRLLTYETACRIWTGCRKHTGGKRNCSGMKSRLHLGGACWQ